MPPDHRARLLARRREFEDRLAAIREGSLGLSLGEETQELATYDNHPADVATTTQLRAQDVAFRDDAERGIQAIQAALERLENGTYGICVECGRPIPEERLEALPEAERCVECEKRAAGALPATATAGGRRPVEEEVLSPPFGRTFTHGSENAAYDGEDAWQDVARQGTSETPSDVPPPDPQPQSYPHVFVDAGERRGAVEAVEELADPDADPASPGTARATPGTGPATPGAVPATPGTASDSRRPLRRHPRARR